MGLAVFSLAAGATAWFSDGGSAGVTVTAGTADLQFANDANCDGAADSAYIETYPGALAWNPVHPGDSASGCFVVKNNGTVALDVYVHHTDVTGDLRNVIMVQYNGTAVCGPDTANSALFKNGRGCQVVASLAAGDTTMLVASSEFPETGGDQNSLQGKGLAMTVEITGYSG